MSFSANIAIGVIADDFTGALDAGGSFVRAGLVTTLRIQLSYSSPSAVQIISTDSREIDAGTARRRVADAARQLDGRRLFKKIDSTMRGHIGIEIEAILKITGLPKALVCPAIIEAGRIIEQGQLKVAGVLLDESDFAHDPAWPARTSDVTRLAGQPATHLSLEIVRSGPARLAQAIAAAPTQIVTLDACDPADLIAIGGVAAANSWLPCGALALGRAWATALTGQPGTPVATPLPPVNRPILIVAGSRHPNTIMQVNKLIAARSLPVVEVEAPPGGNEATQQERIMAAWSSGPGVVIRPQAEQISSRHGRRALVERLGALARMACQVQEPGALVLAGGETASAVCHAIEAAGIRVDGEIEAGVPWGRIIGGLAAEALIVTKAGGFGQAETLLQIVEPFCPPVNPAPGGFQV